MKQFLVIILVMSTFASLNCMQRARSYTDSELDYCQFNKNYHRYRIENQLREKAKQARLARAKAQHHQLLIKLSLMQQVKSPKNQPASSPKCISPSLAAYKNNI